VFQSGDRLCLLQRGLVSWGEGTHVSLQGKWSTFEAAASSTLLPCHNWVIVFKGILTANQKFEGGKRFILLQISLFTWIVKTHVHLKKYPCILWTRGTGTLFPCENRVMFLCQKSCLSRKKTFCARNRNIMHIVSLWKLRLFFKAVFLHLNCFHLEIGSVCSKEAYSAEEHFCNWDVSRWR
jgi:hypothetical protein